MSQHALLQFLNKYFNANTIKKFEINHSFNFNTLEH